MHDNTLTQDNREKLIYVAGRYNQIVKFYNVEELCADKIEMITKSISNVNKARYSIAAFYRLLIPFVLSQDIKKAIYLDSDIIVNLDITELWRMELSDKILGAVPALFIGNDIHVQDGVVVDGFVKPEDYFNSGVLLMNLELLRKEEALIIEGLKFINEHNYLNLAEQPALNYCFSTKIEKLPVRFNQFVRWARRKKEPLMQMIYHYTAQGVSLNMNMSDPFHRLWMSYFIRTPWFNEDTFGKLYTEISKMRNNLLTSAANLSAIISGKTRAFFVEPAKVDAMKKFFSIRDDELIIPAENEDSIQMLIGAMKASQGKCVFFIMTAKLLKKNFPFELLTNEGFALGKDFLKGWKYLSEAHGNQFSSYSLIQVM